MANAGPAHFQNSQVKTENDGKAPAEPRVVKLDTPQTPVVEKYDYNNLHQKKEGDYAARRAKYGPLSPTDKERANRNQKDKRFSLNPLLREPLSIEEEERRVIEEKVRARIAAVSEDARVKAREEGYQDGLAKGHQEAFQKFAAESVERTRAFDSMLQLAETAKVEIFRANERVLMEIIFRIAKTVALKELATDREYIVRLARELIERVGVRENIRIRIHPDDAATAEILKPGLEAHLGTLKNVTIEASPQVKRGGCMVETDWNAIDASLETQFHGLHDALVGKAAAE